MIFSPSICRGGNLDWRSIDRGYDNITNTVVKFKSASLAAQRAETANVAYQRA